MSESTNHSSDPAPGIAESWRRIADLAREVLRDRGLSDGQIEAELTKPPGKSPADNNFSYLGR